MSYNIKKLKIVIDCKKNLFNGDLSKPKSEKIPRIKIKIENIKKT